MAPRRPIKLKDHTVLALDVGTRFIKAAEVRLAKGSISVLNVAIGPTPPDMINNSQILDPVGLGKAVRALLNAYKIKTKRVVASVRGQSSVVVRPIDLPKMTRKELTDTMKFEVERHIPFAVDEVIMDYSPIIEPDELPEEEQNMKVLLAVAQEELINAYIKMLFAAGLAPVALDVEILATIRALVDIAMQAEGIEKTVALVNIGASSTDISIIHEGNLMFTRSVPIAGDALTESVADQLGRSFEEAEELKKEYGRIFLEAALQELPMMGAKEAAPSGDESETPGEALSFFSGFDTLQSQIADAATPATPAAEEPKQDVVFSFDQPLTPPAPQAPPPAAPAAPLSPFSLDDEDDVDDELPEFGGKAQGGNQVFTLDEPGTTPPIFQLDAAGPLPESTPPIFQLDSTEDETANGQFFSLDDNVDDELPATPATPPAAQPATPAPAFPDVDEEPAAFTLTPEPSIAPTPAPADAAPLFDLSSELEEIMPSRPKPAAPAEEEEDPFALFPPAAPATPAPAILDTPSPFSMTETPPAAPEPAGLQFALGDELEEPAQAAPEATTAFAPLDSPLQGMEAPGQLAPFALPESSATQPMDDTMAFQPPTLTPLDELVGEMGEMSPHDPQQEVFQRRVFESMLPTLVELVTEIRRSLEYFSSRETETPIERIILYGGSSRLPNMDEFLQQEIGMKVSMADPLYLLDQGMVRQPAEYLQDLGPVLPVCIGLGLRDMLT